MAEIITFAEIKEALGLPAKARVATVERELRRRNLPFEYGKNCVFTLRSLWENKIAGGTIAQPPDEPIEF